MVFFFGSSCTKEKKEIILKKEKSVIIDLKNEAIFNRTPYIAQITQSTTGEDILIANFFDAEFLYFFDLNNGSILKKIPIGERRLENFHYISNDSIFLLYSNQYNDGYIDSTNFVRINTEGNVLNYYKIEHPNIPNSDNDSIEKEKAFYPICQSASLPSTNEFAVFDLAKWYPEKIGSKAFMEQKTPVLATYNYQNHDLNICEDYWYPGIEENIYYPGQYHSYSTCLSSKGNPLSRFYFSGTVYEWDVKNNKLIPHQFKSQLIDSIYPISEPRTNFTNELEAQYRDINYNPYSKKYFSVLWFNPNIYGYGAYSLIITDEDFNYLGEIFNPNIGTWAPLFTEDNIIGFNVEQEGLLQVDFYTLEQGNKSQEEYISNIKDSLSIRKKKTKEKEAIAENNNIKALETDVSFVDCLNGFTPIQDNKYVLITIFVNQSCPSCVDFALKTLEGNKALFNEYPIYFLLTSNNKEKMQLFLDNYDLSGCKHVVYDENGLVQISTSDEPSNPRFQFVNENSIIHDTIYSPESIGEAMIPEVFDFFGEKVEVDIKTE
jgi:hypothetical protein